MEKLTAVGVDLAKRIFLVHWVDGETGKIVNRQTKRAGHLGYFANRKPCLTGMEVCGGATHWARELVKLGHQVKLIGGLLHVVINLAQAVAAMGGADRPLVEPL